MDREAEMTVVKEVFKAGQGDLEKIKAQMEDAKADYTDVGKLQMLAYSQAQDEFCKYYILWKVRERKAYKTSGMTWENFCESINENRRNLERKLEDLKPLYESFSDKMSVLVGVPLSKIRLLGRSFSDKMSGFDKNGNEIIINGQQFPLDEEHKEELIEALDEMMKASKAEKDQLAAEVRKLKRKQDESVDEAVKEFRVERDALIDQNKKLKDQLKTAHPATLKDVEDVHSLALGLAARVRRLIVEPGNLSNEDKGKISATLTIAMGELNDLWDAFSLAVCEQG